MKNFLILALLFISLTSVGQGAYTVSGIVMDGLKEEKIFPAYVELLDSSNIGKALQVNDDNGQFSLTNVSAGNYSIKITPIGYKDSTFSNIRISGDTTLTFDIHRFCKYDLSYKNKTCPICKKQDRVIPIIYGLLISSEGLGETFVSGGCMITNCDPNWYCKRDKIKF